jgi:glycine dehydrogenase
MEIVMSKISDAIAYQDKFVNRHIGPNARDINEMLKTLGLDSLGSICDTAVPKVIRSQTDIDFGPAETEIGALN